MKPQKQEAIKDKIRGIADHASSADTLGERRTLITSSAGVSFGLADSQAEEYDEVIEQLLVGCGWGEKYSEQYLDRILRNLIGQVLVSDAADSLSAGFQRVVADYEAYSETHVVFVPLFLIQMQTPSLQLGNVVMETISQAELDSVLASSDSVFESTTSSAETIEFVKKKNREILQALVGQTCARFKVVAEPIRAKERAEEETRRAIDLLRYSIPALYEKDLRVSVGIQGELPLRSIRPSFVMSTEQMGFNLHLDTAGPLAAFTIDRRSLEKMESIGVFIASRLMQKSRSEISEFEGTILRGIHKLANAIAQPDKETAFLGLIVGIEGYLTPRDGNPIGTAIAEGVAIILGQALENRRRLKARVKQFYGKRSAISHGGESRILDPELAELTGIVGALTVWMLQHASEFSTVGALLEWIEGQKLS